MITAEEVGLSRDQILGYYEQGWISPVTAFPVEDMLRIRERIEREVLATRGLHPNPDCAPRSHRHLDRSFLLELCRSPVFQAVARQLLGEDVMVWATNFWQKDPGAPAIPWHQDIEYWPLNPPVNLSFWLAIDRVTRENSCIQVIPGSHQRRYTHRPVTGQMLGHEAVTDGAALPEPVALELEPGQFAIFNERLLHHSAPNTSALRRLGFGIRMTVPFVRVDSDHPLFFPGHRCVMLCGKDRFGINRIAEL